MSQHSYNVTNQLAAAFRSDVNNALQALASNSSGPAAPATTYAYMWWPDTNNGVLKQRNANNSAWIVRGPLAETLMIARSANAVLAAGDFGRIILATGTWTQTFNPAATLGDGWWVEYRNDGSGTITLDPNAAELIDGATTIQLAPGETCCIYCDGTQVKTIGRSSPVTTAALTAFLATVNSWSKGQSGAIATLTDATTIAVDLSLANNFKVTLAGNRTLGNPTNIVPGQSGIIAVTQDATGSRTLAFGAYWKFSGGVAPTLSSTANAVDNIAYYVETATRITAALVKDVK